jgi:ATPase subunit of ABC transporter with duplicated ATPase domains
MSSSLVVRGVTVRRGVAVVLDGVDLTVGPQSRVGVVGPNGVGKSTLLRVLAGLVEPDAGTVTRTPPNATVGYLPQEPDRVPGESLRDELTRRTGVAAAEAAMNETATALGAGAPGADDAYAAALEQWLALGGADLDVRMALVCADLGLPERALDQDTVSLSGGQAARASLAAVLLSRFDVLLLDEPTNDLDFAGLDRLERFLDEVPGAVVIVSHDRAFLDRTIRSVLEIAENAHTAALFNGGWTAFLDQRAVARRHAEEAYAGYTAQKSRLQERAQMQRQWSTAGVKKATTRPADNDKNIRHHNVSQSQKLASKAKQTERAMERLDAVDKPWEGWRLELEFAAAPRSGDVVARLSGAVIERGSFRLGPVDLEIGAGERIALLGPNGSGKSTLLGALLGRFPLASGDRWFGPGVVVGELDQGRGAFLDGDGALLRAFADATGLLPQEARSLLAKFGLGAEHVGRAASTLSPGERTRAQLAVLMATGVNCLVLDEPTNHLDLPAIEQLEQALDRFPGTVLLVTHDRRLLDAVRITRTIEVGEGQVVGRD